MLLFSRHTQRQGVPVPIARTHESSSLRRSLARQVVWKINQSIAAHEVPTACRNRSLPIFERDEQHDLPQEYRHRKSIFLPTREELDTPETASPCSDRFL